MASESSMDDFEGQTDDVFTYLQAHESDIKALMEGAEAKGVLDFAVETSMGFLFRQIPAPLVRHAADLNLALEVSIYPGNAHEG
jgi:hypothetical protein